MRKVCVPIEDFIRTLNIISDFQDVETKDHTRRVRDICTMLGERVGFAGNQLLCLQWGADIHDLGKLALEPLLLRQATKLTRSQTVAMRKHPEFGAEMLRYAGIPKTIIHCVLYHQEHYDGTGYPEGLKGEEIPLAARIVCIADVWDSITSDRPYRRAMSRNKAIATMARHSTWFDKQLYTIFRELQEKGVI